MSNEGQRQTPRFALDARIEFEAPTGRHEGRCINLSSGGLCAQMAESVALGSDLKLSVTLVFDVDSFSEPLSLRARSVWCTALGEGYQVGFQFLPLDHAQSSYLAMFLRFLEEGRAARGHSCNPDTDDFS